MTHIEMSWGEILTVCEEEFGEDNSDSLLEFCEITHRLKQTRTTTEEVDRTQSAARILWRGVVAGSARVRAAGCEGHIHPPLEIDMQVVEVQ